jgi:hypothetical protein
MLENCLSGSEGGGAFALPTPIFTPWRVATGLWRCFPRDLQSPLDAQESNVA